MAASGGINSFIDSAGSLGSALDQYNEQAPLSSPQQGGVGQQDIAPYAYNKQTTSDLLAGFSQQAGQDRNRYFQTMQQLFSQIPGLQQQLLGQIDQSGQLRTQQIGQAFQDTTHNALASLSDRGIGGSTYAVNAQQGAQRDQQMALNQLNDSQMQQKIGVEQSLGNTLFGAESQYANKSFADPNTLIALLQSLGRAGGGLDQAGVSQSLSSNVKGIFSNG